MFTARHYEATARVLHEVRARYPLVSEGGQAVDAAAEALAVFYAGDNKHFDTQKFIRAAGYGGAG
jgi:hypothetical protein